MIRQATETLLAISLGIVGIVLWKLRNILLEPFRSSLLNLPGPTNPSWFLGNLRQIFESDGESVCEEWVEQYGHTIMYRGWFNVSDFAVPGSVLLTVWYTLIGASALHS